MPDIRLTRAADGRCTVFVGGALVFTNLDAVQADHLVRAFGGQPARDVAPAGDVAPARDVAPAPPRRSVGGQPGRLANRRRTPVADAALARLR